MVKNDYYYFFKQIFFKHLIFFKTYKIYNKYFLKTLKNGIILFYLGRIVFYTRLDLKIGPKSLYLLYLSPRPNERVKIKLKDITFQNSFLKMPLAIKNEKQQWAPQFSVILSFSLSLSLSLYSLYFSHILIGRTM